VSRKNRKRPDEKAWDAIEALKQSLRELDKAVEDTYKRVGDTGNPWKDKK